MKLALPNLNSAETLGRTVISRKVANRAGRTGLVDYSVFLEKPDALSVSVDRMDHASSIAFMVKLAQQRAESRTPSGRSEQEHDFYFDGFLKRYIAKHRPCFCENASVRS